MNEVRILKPGDEVALDAFLLPRIESSMFLVSNSRAVGLLDNGERYAGTYAALFEGDRITNVAALYWNGSLVLQAPTRLGEVWRFAARHANRSIQRVIGPLAQVAEVLESLGVSQENIQMDEPEHLYRLDLDKLQVPTILRDGTVTHRLVREEDFGVVLKFRLAYAEEAMNTVITPQVKEDTTAGIRRSMQDQNLWVLLHGGEIVSMTGANSWTNETIQVGGVYTPPDLRGRGYGRAVVAGQLLDARELGASVGILFTGIDNVPAQKAYEAIGFQYIGGYRIMVFKEGVRMG